MSIECEHCKKSFSNKYLLSQHQNKAKYCLAIQKKNNEEFKCFLCQKILSTKYNLEVHKEKCKGKKDSFKCEHCDAIIASKQNLDIHKKKCKKVSDKKDVFKCKHCKKILSTKQSLLSHVNCCFEKKEKEFNERKINSNILKSLNSVDTRIILWQSYYTIALEYDHIQNLSSCLDFSVSFPEEYEKFDYDSFFKKFHNYGSVIFSIRDLIKKYLFNSYGSFNFIYLHLIKSSDEDPFSFYRLHDIREDGRKWVMDCRAETLTNNFISDLKPYLIMMFRKIYYDIFHDNNYRPNFSGEAVIAETDCEQLIKNILVLSNPIECCNLFRTLIKENATHKQTKEDAWSMYADDDFQKKKFKKNVKPDILDIIRPLFEDRSSEQAVDFYREKC